VVSRKSVVKSLVLVAVFAAVLVVAAGPSRLRAATEFGPLAVAFGFVWFVTFLVGWIVFDAAKSGVKAATALAVGAVLVVGGVGYLAPPAEEQAPVWFSYQASFTYRGSADNLPIENVALRFPCPHVENEEVEVLKGTWTLYHQDEENVLWPQLAGLDNGDIVAFYGYRGQRNENLEILLTGIEPTIDGPKLYYKLSKLYPREVFMMSCFAFTLAEDADKVTLRSYGDNEGRAAGHYQYMTPDPWTYGIDFSFWTRLLKKVNDNFEIIETFSRSLDNLRPGWKWLYPA
jgi:hypothetical protein